MHMSFKLSLITRFIAIWHLFYTCITHFAFTGHPSNVLHTGYRLCTYQWAIRIGDDVLDAKAQ